MSTRRGANTAAANNTTVSAAATAYVRATPRIVTTVAPFVACESSGEQPPAAPVSRIVSSSSPLPRHVQARPTLGQQQPLPPQPPAATAPTFPAIATLETGVVVSGQPLSAESSPLNGAVDLPSAEDRAAAVVAEALKSDPAVGESWANASFRSRADRAKTNYDTLLRDLAARSSRVRKHVAGTYRYLRRLVDRHERRALETLTRETRQQEKLLLDRARLDYAIEGKWVIERGLNQELHTLRVSSSNAALAAVPTTIDERCRQLVQQKDRLRVAMLNDLYFEINTLTAVRETVNARLLGAERAWDAEFPRDETTPLPCSMANSTGSEQNGRSGEQRQLSSPRRTRAEKDRMAVTLMRRILDDEDAASAVSVALERESSAAACLPAVHNTQQQQQQHHQSSPRAAAAVSAASRDSSHQPSSVDSYQSLLARLYATPRSCVICCNFLPGHRFLFAADCSHSHCADCVRRSCELLLVSQRRDFTRCSFHCMECRKPVTAFVEVVRCTANGERYTLRPRTDLPPAIARQTAAASTESSSLPSAR